MKEVLKFEQAAVIFDNYALRGAHDILVREDGIAFVAGKFGSFGIVDVRNPLKPEIRGYFGASEFNESQTVYVKGRYCFLGGNSLRSIDAGDIDHPVVTKTIVSPEIHQINGFSAYGNYLFGASKHGFINVFDISKPDEPRYTGSFNAKADAGFVSPHDLCIVNDEYCLFVSSEHNTQNKESRSNRVGMYRCIDKAQEKLLPFDRWELVAKSDDEAGEGANRVLVHNRHAYVACNMGCRILIYSLSEPTLLERVASLETTAISPCGIRIDGDTLYIGAEDAVQAVSIADPRHPITISDRRYPEMFPSNATHREKTIWLASNAHDLDVYQGYLFVTGQFDNCIGVIKL